MNPKPSLYMQSSICTGYIYSPVYIVLYGFARALYESKAFTIHAGFHGSGCIGHCMSPKPSLYMQGSMALHG